MVNIAGYELNLGWGSLNSVIVPLFWGVMILVVVCLLGWGAYSYFTKKTKYTNPVTVSVFLENGSKKTISGLRGGKYLNSRTGTWDFRVKIPGQRKPKELGYMPDFSKADADGTVHFITDGDGTIWIQTVMKLVTKEIVTENGKEYEYSLLMKPIRNDVKTVTINSMRNWSDLINKNKMTAFTLGLGMFLIMVIAHLISLYIQTKIKCTGTP